MPDNVDKLFEIMQAKSAASDRGKFRKVFLTPGNKGYKIRKDIYDGLRADGIIDSPTYEDFRRKLRLGGTPTVNKYRQQMFSSVDPNKSRASELTHRAVGQAVRATNNVRKPVTAKVVNRKGKPTGEEFAITPAKTVEDLDREYAQETTKNWENELHDQMADADKDAAKISDMFKSFIGSTDEVGSVWGNMTRGGGIAGTPHSVTTNNGILENTEARQILAAGDYNRKRRELLQLEQDSRNGAIFDNHSFFRGMYDAAKDTGFLTGGASDLINAGSLLATKQDLDNGVHTEAGDMLMQQAVKNSDAQSQYGDNQGWMYTGGVITTNMAPFMVQIGSAGFSKGMSNAIGKVVQGAASKVALGTMEKATGMVGAHIANYIGKVTGLTTKAFGKAIQYGIVGAAQANTVGLGNVANDVINRYTGQVYQDEHGNYKFGTFDSDGKLVHEGGEDFLTALVKGDAAQTIEFATELAGGGIDAVGTALKNFVSKGGKKIINKYNMENVSKVVDFLLNNKVSKNARYLKAGADRTLGKVELNSIVGESLEEELGIIANTVFTGDNKISDLWDEKQQSQIWGGMLLSIGLMKGAVAPFHAYNAKQYYSYKHKLDKADVNLSQLLGKEKWEELRNQIDATTNEDMPEMVNKINRDVALGKNRQPVREYIQNLLIMRGYDIGNMLAAKKAVEDKGEGVSVKNMEKNQAYQQGRDAYGYDTHEIQLDQEDKQKSLAQLLGISEQQLASMSEEELEALSGRDDNIDRAIYDYQLSTARYEGVIDNARDQIDLEVQRAAQAVDMYTDKSSNTIRNATIKATGGLEDYGVYIINGNIATHEDGSIDISNSDDMILYYDPTTNTVEHADAMMFAELGSEENADEVRSQAMADAKEKAIKETTGIIDGVVEVGTQFKTVDADGTEHTYEVLADNGDGTAMITIDGNVPTELVKGENVNIPVSFEELQKMKDESDQQRLQAAKAQREQMEKERAEQQMQAQTTQAKNPSQEDNIQPAPIEDNLDYSDIIREDGKVQMVDVSDKDGNNLFPDAKDVFYIQGNKMRTKFAYIDANGELKTQSFPTGLVKIKTRGEVSVDDYKKYRATILSAESSAMPESSMIEDNSGTIEANRGGIDVEDNTQPLSEADADNVIAQMESSAETAPDLELTPDNWTAEFGEDGILSTPIGDVKMGENQVAKLFEKGRSKEFGMIKPTLTNPDVIIEVPSHSTDGNEERSSSYLFIKTFLGKNGKKVYYFKSVTIKKDGLEISISSHYDRVKRVKEALMKGKLLYRKNDGAQTEQNQPSASVTTSQEDAAGSSESKDTNISSNGNENNESLTFEDGTPIPVDMNGEVDLSQTDASHAAEWYDNNLGEDADDWLDGEIKKAKKVLEQAKNKKLAGTKPSELVASKKEKEAAIADAQAHYDSAISIRDSLKERRIAKEENSAEGRRNLIEKARRKFARLKSAVKDDAEAVSQLYRETIGSLLHRLYDGTGIDVTDTTPLTAEEYVASNLGAHSLNYEGTETSKGVKQETGLSREDFAKTQLLAADGKGTTIDALVHSLWENRPSNLESLDTQDIRNALIGVLNSGFKASEARNFVENIRIAQAENILEEQKRAQENAAYAEQHKAEPEAELKAKSDEKAELKAKSEEKLDNESSNESNDLGNDLDNEKTNDKINDNINAPEVPEDATDENPLGLQLSEDKVPFEIEGGKSGETYDINDNEDRQRLINDNKVDDKDILDIDMPKHVHKAIKELCKKMGLKVQFLYMGARSNGWIENGTMYLALDTEKATQFVFGHEMTHAIKQKNPEAYKELVKVAMAVTTKKKFEEDLAKVYQNYHGISGYNNVDDYVEEVVADNLGKFINDFDLAQKFSLRLNHPILGTILHAIQKIKSLLYGDFYKSVDALERIAEKAYVETAKGQVTNSETGEDVSFSLRQKPEPKKKGIGYKVFVLKDGKLYPPMVANPDGAATPVGVWLDADAAPIAGESKTGRPQVKQGGKGTQGGSGKLAYRPGWHLGVVPYAIQFNRKDAEGNKTLFPKNFVFAEVEYAADVDYQEEARQEGINPSGKYQHSLAGLKHLPTDGYYMYRTNPNPETDPWVITGAMKVNRILTRAEQADLVSKAGREPQQIQEGDIVTDDVVNSINQEIADAPKFSLKVYHGSGADFTEFDFDHMGEGAGSQVFGWGGYVTSSKKIGKSYATLMDNDPSKAYYRIQRSNGTRFAKKYPTLESFMHGDKQIAMNDKFTEQEKIDFYNEMKKLAEPYHNLYEVDIPDDNDSNYLDWDKPLSKKQQDAIREGLEHLGVGIKTLESKGQSLERTGENIYNSTLYIGLTGTEYDLPERTKGISKFLSSVGFTGIKYKAGRNFGGAKKGDTNYVIFKPEDMKITQHTKFSLRLKSAIEETETNPSDAQKESGNYKKGHIKFGGYDYTIENPKGSTRSGKDADGKEWKVTMHDTYGYIRGKFGKDGDHLDMFINDKADLDNWDGDVFVVDQVNPDGSFDEHKVMYGYDSMDDAKKAYLANYSDGWQGLGNITGVSKDEFDKWLDTSKRKLKPFADYAKVKFSLKSKPVRFEAGKKLSDEEKKEVLSTLKDAYKVNGVPYHIEETAGGKEKRVYEPTADSYVVSDITNRPLRYYITLPDGRVAHPTEVYPSISDNEVKSSATKQGLLDEEVDQIVSAAIGNMKDIADNAKAIEVLTELQNLPHETHDVGYGMNNAQSYNYKTGIFTSDAAQAIDYVVRRMRRKEDVPAEVPTALKKAVADSYGMVDNLIDGMSNTKGVAAEIKPVGVGAFGNIYNQFRGKAKAAIEFLKKVRGGEAVGALHHKDIGDIDLVWGKEGTGHSDGYGLSKLVKYHPEVLDNLQEILNDMRVVSSSKNRVNLESETHKAGVRLTWDGERKSWLLTAFKKETSASDKRTDTAATSLEGDTALSQTEGSAAKIDNSSETAKENGEKFSLKDEKTMFGMHNISLDKLRKAIKQGGFAAPSMGVIDSKNGIYSGYGEITLIPKAEKIAKRTGKNIGTYAADAWTPIYPPVEKKFGGNGGDVAYDDIESVPKEMQRLTRNAINSFMDGREANGLAYLYLQEKGKAPELVLVEGKYPKELHDEVKGILGKLNGIYNTTDEQKEKLLDLFIREVYDGNKEEFDNDIKKFIKKDEELIKKRPNSNIAKNKQLDVDWMKEHGYDYGALSRFVDGILRDAETSGKVDENATMKAAQQYIQDKGMKEDFDSWKEKLNDRYNVEEVIFAGYKPDGNRKYLPNTVENAVKVMKQDGKNASVGSASFSHFVASILKPMGTLDQIRKKKGNLTGNYEDVEKFQEKWQPVYDELADKMQPDAEPFESYGMDRLEEVATQKNPKKYAKEEYGVDLTDEDINKLNELIEAVKNDKPSIYFETKFMRPYGLDEFEKAIVPNDTPSDVVDALKMAGIDVSSYERGNAEDRQKVTMDAINSSDNIRFSLKSMMAKPEGWKQANKKAIHIAEAIERDPKFSLKNLDDTLIKAGTYFSGGGLVEEGLKGIIDPVVAVEYDEKISGVYRNNFGQHIVTADVRDVDPKELVKQIDGEVEYFHASPVCKNYSQAKSNHAEVELDKETAASTAEFINAVKPKVVTIENVKGYKDSDAMKTITDALDANGYTWDADVYNAADYGGYTNRERLIVRAVRDGKLPEKPKKMAHKSGWYEAVADIIPTLTEKKNGVAPWMDIRLKADGIDWRNIDKPLYVMGSAYADGKVPHAFADELLPTLRTKSGDVIVMPDGKVYRAMGRVLARVSGVSDDYKMPFSENLSHTIIGNGIPTQLTEHVIAPLLTGSDPKFSIRTYHGTGASFDKFDFSHMGEGEGSQAFGWGGYVTNSKDIAEDYTRRAKIRKDNGGFEFVTDMSANNKDMVRQYIYKHKDVNKGLDAMRKDLSSALEMFPDDDDLKELSNILAKKNEEIAVPDNIAYLYDVDIPDDNGDYLDWDAPLTDKQKNTIIKELRRLKIDFADFKKRGFSFDGSFGGNAYDFLMYALRKTKKWKDVDASRAVSKFLSSIGFTGIKYKAGTIFGGAKEGDTNYVIFDENNANIVGNTKFSLRGSTPYGKQMEEWMEKNHLEKGAVPMEKPIMKEGENIFDYANRMVEWTRNQNLWKTAPKQTGFQDALDKWKADNGLSPDAYPPVRPHRENYSTEIGYAEDLEEYNKKKELWKSAPKPKDFDLSVDLEDMNKQLRNIRRAVLNQKNYDQRTVKAVSDLVRKMLNIGWGDGLSRGKVGNLLSAAKNATGANDVKKYLDKAMGILADNYLNRLSTAYDNLINTKGARADQSGVIKMGSLDAKGQAFMSEYKKAINMDDSSLNTYIANIEEDSAKNEDNVEMNDYRLAGIQAAIMYKQQIGGNDADIAELMRQIGELKNKKDATKEDKDLLKSLEKKLFENKFDRITMYENLLNNIQRIVKESKSRAKEFREEIAEHKNEILHRANLDLEGVDSAYYDTTTAKKKFVNNPILRFVMSSTYTFEQFLKFFGRHHANGEGYLYNYFMSEWQDAADEQQLYNEMNRNALDEKTKELFGKKNFTKLVGIDGKGMMEMDVEVTDYSNKETGKRTIHLKQGQMLYIYLVNKETDGEMKLRAMGITEEKVAEIEENLDPRVKAMGEWLQDEYLPECQRRYQATHTKYFGAPMKEVENYFPLAINNRARNIREDLNQDTDAISRLAGTSTGAIITRRVNVIPLDIENADAFAVAFNHLDEMEEWSAYLPFIQDVNTLLSSTHFRNQVMNMSSAAYGSGKTLWEEFKKVAQIAAGTYKPKVDNGMMDSKIAAVVGGIATAKISGRLWTAFKQTQSATTFLTECDPARFLWYGVNPYGSWHWAYDNLPLFRKRVEQLTAGDVKVRQFLDELEKYHDWTKTIAKVGMSPNILVDSVTCAVGARSVYETELNKLTKLGYSKDNAEEKAIQKASLSYNKTQQSSEGAFLSPMQVDRTYVSAALSLYKNANYAYGRKKIEAIRGIAKTYRFWGEHKNAMIGSMTRQIMDEDGLDENVANAIAKRAYTRTFWYNIGTLLNYMTIVPISWAAYKVLLYLLNGDDDDKKKKMIEEACLKGFATTTFDDYVIPFASNVLNAGLNIEDGKIGFDTDVFKYQNLYINPATSDLSNIYSMIGNQKWWSAGNKFGMLGIQMLVGFNPETIGALYQAYDEFDKDSGNMPLEIKLAVLKSISAPEESIRGLYMDELGLDNEDRTKVPLSVLEQRYAERQINRDNLLSQIFMPKEDFDGYVEKYKKSFEKKIQEKMDKMDAYDQRKFDAIFDTTTDPALKGMMEKKRTKDANAAADEQIAKEGLNQEKKGKEPSEEAYDAVKMSIDVAEDNAISTYNKVLNKRYAALNDEYNEQTDAMKYIFMSKHPNFKAYKELESEYAKYGKKIKELKEKLVSADGYDAKQTILKQIRAKREKFSELQSKVR